MTDGQGAPSTATATIPVYPSDARDGWEPGAPSLRAIAPSIVGGALIPLAVYNIVRHQGTGDATALAIAGIPAAMWVAIQWARQRRIDPIGAGVLFGFIAGITISFAMGGNAFVLKVRDSVLTGLFGLLCLASLRFSKPVMFYLGRALSAGDDPLRLKAYDELWEIEEGKRVFFVITAVWGFGLLLEAAARVLLAVELSTGVFLAVSPAVASIFFAMLFTFTVRYSKRTRRRGEASRAAEAALAAPAVEAAPPMPPDLR